MKSTQIERGFTMGFERLIKKESTNHHHVITTEMAEWLTQDPENQVF